MYKAKILIISRRKELSIKYKKLIEALEQDIIYTNDLSESLSVIQNDEIEFIIVSDTIKEKLSEFIRKIRVLTYNTHPVIIAVSKSNDIEDKLQTLEAGADDFWGEEISKQEFQIRFKAHLRRYFESSLNPVTHLFNKSITIKELKKNLKSDAQKAYVLLKITGIDNYRLTYGEIAYEKVLQTLAAIINSTVSRNDYTGHIQESEFILTINPIQAEKLAAFLVFAFDNILNKFYSVDEFNNNFTIQTGDMKEEERNSLMKLNIAVVEKNDIQKDFRTIINNLNELIKLCENSKHSTYMIDRMRLNGIVKKAEEKNKVLILEFDSSLAYLLKNVCELNGLNIQTVDNYDEFKQKILDFKPQVVVLDWGKGEKSESLELASEISKTDVKLIFSSSYLNKKEILKTGADLYLPKPYEIDDIIKWIKKFLR